MPNRPLLASLLLALPLACLPAHAHTRAPAPAAEASGGYVLAQRALSLEEAVARVQQRYGGRVLDARERGNHYRIKLLTRDGEVRIVRVDPQTGAMR